MLVIGIGNHDRGDDAAGLVAADLAEGTVFEGDLSGLLELWSHDDDVVVVDAMQTGRPPGSVVWFEVSPDRSLPCLRSDLSSHALDLSQAIELARRLDRMPWRLRVVGIEVGDVEMGHGLSWDVHTAVEELAAVLHPAAQPEVLAAVP